ncbi:hypothetical protein LTR53_020235, partial [Teratosphaeriaceae sp. CCFEE 6253]
MVTCPGLEERDIQASHAQSFGEDAVIGARADEALFEAVAADDRAEGAWAAGVELRDFGVGAAEERSFAACSSALEVQE